MNIDDLLFQKIENFLSMKENSISAMQRLKIESLRDLLFYQPSNYKIMNVDHPLNQLQDEQFVNVLVQIDEIEYPRKKSSPMRIAVSNDTGSLVLVFFNFPKFMYAKLKPGQSYRVSGKVKSQGHYYQITHPEFSFVKSADVADKCTRFVQAIYPLTYGITNTQICSYVQKALTFFETSLFKIEDEIVKTKALEILYHLKIIHMISLEKGDDVPHRVQQSKRFLAFLELSSNQRSLARLRKMELSNKAIRFTANIKLQKRVLDKLGFILTNAQDRALSEIQKDQASSKVMIRMLQGDVGSGKTLVALLSSLNVITTQTLISDDDNSYFQNQVVIMSPTDLLSRQHYNFFKSALSDLDIKVEILTSGVASGERKRIMTELASGEIAILIGTHALFQEKVSFKNLCYVIIDEQHRFGVEQRRMLIEKGNSPDVLIMTATPIPRSLRMTMFGDIDISIIDEKPSDRLPIVTRVFPLEKEKEIYNFLQKIIYLGQKIYWICPLIEQKDEPTENTTIKVNDVYSRYEVLNSYFHERVSIIHGKMKQQEKDQLMQEFRDGDKSILIATTVIEVGIDIKNASLIIIENAETFGLAQLHQLRGRVGRSNIQSYCFLLYNPLRLSEHAKMRLKMMKSTNDGFVIAEEDLKLRGAGDVLGTKQSGEPEFFFAVLERDTDLLIKANKEAISEDYQIEFMDSFFLKNNGALIN